MARAKSKEKDEFDVSLLLPEKFLLPYRQTSQCIKCGARDKLIVHDNVVDCKTCGTSLAWT